MAEMIRCDHCGASLRLPEGYAGREVRCPSCQQVFTAKPLREPSPITASLAPDEPPPRSEPPRRSEPPEPEPPDEMDEEEAARLARRRQSYTRARFGPMRALPHRGGTALGLGIGSIALFCIPGLALAMGVGAIIVAAIDLPKMRDGRMDPDGRPMTMAGLVCGIIGVIVCALAVFGWCLLGPLSHMK